MPARQKRTYNLRPATVRAVRELADEFHAAPTQDAVIELAVDELRRRVRDEAEAAVWAAAREDPAFVAEAADLESSYGPADRETWPA